MPSNQAAWIVAKQAKPLKVQDAEYHSPAADEILIKNHSIAINPVDWKIQDYGMFLQRYPFIMGTDVAGEVAEVGSDVKDFKKGQRVIGHAVSLGTQQDRHGGFQLYTAVPSVIACEIPQSISFERGVVLPLAVNTAAAGLFQKDFLAMPHPSEKPKASGKAVLIWGGSSSVGSAAIQLAKASGAEIFTTASSRNFDFVKGLGASHVFDHASPTVNDEIADALKGKEVYGAYDAISDEKTTKACAAILVKSKGTKFMATVLPPPEDLDSSVKASSVFGITPKDNEVGPAVWRDFLPQALTSGYFQPAPRPEVIGNTLDDVQKAMDANRAGMSAAKAVVKLI